MVDNLEGNWRHTYTHTRTHTIPTFSSRKKAWHWPAVLEWSWLCLWTFSNPALTSPKLCKTLSATQWVTCPVTRASTFPRAEQRRGHGEPGLAQLLDGFSHCGNGNGWPLSPFSFSCSRKPISCFNLSLMNRNTELAWRMRNYCIIGSNHKEHKKPFKVIKLLPSPFLYFFSAPHGWAVYLRHHNWWRRQSKWLSA